MVAWVVLVATAAADPGAPASLQACCDAAGASQCPAELVGVGPGSEQQVAPDGTTITGLWRLGCSDGGSFDASGHQVTTHPFPPSSILTPLLPSAMACFEASCRLPEGACLRYDGKRVHLAVCADGSSAPDAMWRAQPRAARRAVVMGGRVVQNGTGSPVPRAAAPTSAPSQPPQPVDASVPDAAPDPCRSQSSLRTPSNQQVDEGNEAMVARDLGLALDKYRAAITINKCNAFAWAALGDALLQSGHPQPARTSLEVATRLMPTNVHAWTTLGHARARGGDKSGAADAYRTALQHKPDHPPAAQGLQGVQ